MCGGGNWCVEVWLSSLLHFLHAHVLSVSQCCIHSIENKRPMPFLFLHQANTNTHKFHTCVHFYGLFSVQHMNYKRVHNFAYSTPAYKVFSDFGPKGFRNNSNGSHYNDYMLDTEKEREREFKSSLRSVISFFSFSLSVYDFEVNFP